MTDEQVKAERGLCWHAMEGDGAALEFIKSGWAFSDPLAAQIAGEIRSLLSAGVEASYLAVANSLSAKGAADAHEMVLDSMTSVVIAKSANECIALLRRNRAFDALAAAGEKLRVSAERREGSPLGLVEETLKRLQGATGERAQGEFSASQAVAAAGEEQKAEKVTTGVAIIDNTVGRLRQGSTVLIGAGTGEGKSVLALQIAVSMARQGQNVLYICAEMAVADVGRRLLAMEGFCEPYNEQQIAETVERYKRIGLVFRRDLSVDGIRAALVAQDFRVLIVDYIQLLTGQGSNAYERATAVSKALTQMTVEKNLVTVLVSQLSRNFKAERRPPELRDLRDSGQIEQDSSVALLLSSTDEEQAEKQGKRDLFLRAQKRGLELKMIDLAKHRNGKGRLRQFVGFNGQRMMFESLDWLPG